MAIGQRVGMIDGRQRVMGTIDYALNAELPGALIARLVTSPYAHARILSVDVSAARRVPGVRAVICGTDLQSLGMLAGMDHPPGRRPALALDRVRYVGEPVVAVAADDEEAALEAAALVVIEYEELPAVTDIRAALEPNAPVLHGAGNLAGEDHFATGDIEAGFAEADEVYEDEFTTPGVQHVPLEPHSCLAAFQGDRLVVWSSTQAAFGLRDELAHLLGISRSRVRVLAPSLGGGFGAKLAIFMEPIPVALARATGRPVRLTLTRAEEFTSFVRHPSRIRLRTGVMRDGRLVARESVCYFSNGAYGAAGRLSNGGVATASLYRIPNVKVDMYAVYTNTVPGGSFRAPGVPQAAWASEMQINLIAQRLGLDPLELRRKNLVRDGDRFVIGGRLDDLHFDELIDRAIAEMGWDGPEQRRNDETGRRRIGRAVIPTLKMTQTPEPSNAVLKLNEDGSVHLLTSVAEMGQGSRTALAQIAAHALGVPLESISVVPTDTDVSPWEGGTGSSRATYHVGGAVMSAGEDLLGQLRELAAKQFEVAPEDVVFASGRAQVQGVPDRGGSFGEIMVAGRRRELRAEGHFLAPKAPDPVTGKPGASAHWHHGVVAAEVAVDTETGRVEVTRLWAGVYAGRIVNPVLCDLQVHGSVLMGLGEALIEQMQYEDGTLVTNTLAEYNIPSMRDAPSDFQTCVLEDTSKIDIHGIGETLVPAGPAVIGSAVADAIGVIFYDLPLTPERILTALRSRTSDGAPLQTSAPPNRRVDS